MGLSFGLFISLLFKCKCFLFLFFFPLDRRRAGGLV